MQRVVNEDVLPVDGGYMWPDGSIFLGERNDLNTEGSGQIKLPTGYRYQGNFEQGWLHGSGKASGPDGEKYAGQWAKGLPNGFGKWFDSLGNQYKGVWRAGKREGSGEFTWASGSHYQGQWLNDQPHGLGRLVTSTGDRYVGDFGHGKPHGQGTMYWADGSQYTGTFRSGEAHGVGHCVRDMALMSCSYAEGVLTQADRLTVESPMNVSMIAVNDDDQSMVPIVLEEAFWQSFGAMLSRQIKIFTSAKLGRGLHFTIDNYSGSGRYALSGSDVMAVLPVKDKLYQIGRFDKIKAVVDIVEENNGELFGHFTVSGLKNDPDSWPSGVTLRNGQFRAKKWE